MFEYRNMCTEVTAVDAADPEASTGKKITYQFNDVGNVTCIKDELGHAQFTKFSASLKNAPSESSKMQKAVVNRLRRPDFSGEWSSVIGGTDTVTLDTATRCLGEPSVAIAKTGAGESLPPERILRRARLVPVRVKTGICGWHRQRILRVKRRRRQCARVGYP